MGRPPNSWIASGKALKPLQAVYTSTSAKEFGRKVLYELRDIGCRQAFFRRERGIADQAVVPAICQSVALQP